MGFTTAADCGGPLLRVGLFGGILKDLLPPHSFRVPRKPQIRQLPKLKETNSSIQRENPRVLAPCHFTSSEPSLITSV